MSLDNAPSRPKFTRDLVPGDVISSLDGVLTIKEVCRVSDTRWKLTVAASNPDRSYSFEADGITVWNQLVPETKDDFHKWLDKQHQRYTRSSESAASHHNHIDAFKFKMKAEAIEQAIQQYKAFKAIP